MKTDLAVKIIRQTDEDTARRFLQHYIGDTLVRKDTEKLKTNIPIRKY